MENREIYIAGSDLFLLKSIKEGLGQISDYNIQIFNDYKDAVNKISKTTSILVLDTTKISEDIFNLLSSVKNQNLCTSVIIISDSEDFRALVKLFKEGVSDIIHNEENVPERVVNSVGKIIRNRVVEDCYAKSINGIIERYRFDKIIGESLEMQKVSDSLKKVIDTNINVSLHGEIGTGKEMIAKIIHYNSERKFKPFISVDLRTISEEVRDIKLLGKDSSITADKTNQIGILERANGGTIFIEGFEDVNEGFQIYLQKILYNKEIIRVGGVELIPLDIRIIISYNHSLAELVSLGKINELQYFRTMGMPIEIPSLRQRGADIIILAKKFIKDFTSSNNMKAVRLNLDAQEKLIHHPFPGNVQELKSVVELATVMCSNNTITEDDIKFSTYNKISDFLVEEKTLKDYTRGIVKHFLTKYDDNVLLVAEKLDVGKSTIYRMIKNNEV